MYGHDESVKTMNAGHRVVIHIMRAQLMTVM